MASSPGTGSQHVLTLLSDPGDPEESLKKEQAQVAKFQGEKHSQVPQWGAVGSGVERVRREVPEQGPRQGGVEARGEGGVLQVSQQGLDEVVKVRLGWSPASG